MSNAPDSVTIPATPPVSSSQTIDRAELLHQFESFELNFRRDHFSIWLGTLIGPWVATIIVGAVIYLTCGARFFNYLLGAATFSFVIAGRFIIPMQDFSAVGPLTPEHLFWLVTYQDVMVALCMAFHVGFLFKLPKIGPKFLELMADGEMILSLNPWMRNLTFAGLVAFIAFPLAATGSVGGAIFGRLLGLSRSATFWGSVIGAVIGNGAMLYSSRLVLRYLPADSWTVRLGGPLIIVALIVLLERRYAAMKRQFLTNQNSPQLPGDPQ